MSNPRGLVVGDLQLGLPANGLIPGPLVDYLCGPLVDCHHLLHDSLVDDRICGPHVDDQG